MPRFLSLVAALLTAAWLSAGQASTSLSPTAARIDAAAKLIASNPKSAESYNALAFAYTRAARDNQDETLYDKANAALKQSLTFSPGNYEARKLQITVLAGEHQFAEALAVAKELNRRVPDDIAVWGLLADVNIALGNYAEAERDAQWILDLRAGNSLGFAKAAVLRHLFGDPEGAFEFFEESRRRTSPGDVDEISWLLTEEGRMQLELGDLAKAESLVSRALHVWPQSQGALAALADVRLEQHLPADAAVLLEQRCRTLPNSENLYAWALALEENGEIQRSRSAFNEFEKKALTDPEPSVSLIYYYANGKRNAPEALALAERRVKLHQDVATLDAYAWALYANEKYPEAKQQMDRALAVGIRNPTYSCHAAHIAARTSDPAAVTLLQHELQDVPDRSCSLEFIAASPEGMR